MPRRFIALVAILERVEGEQGQGVPGPGSDLGTWVGARVAPQRCPASGRQRRGRLALKCTAAPRTTTTDNDPLRLSSLLIPFLGHFEKGPFPGARLRMRKCLLWQGYACRELHGFSRTPGDVTNWTQSAVAAPDQSEDARDGNGITGRYEGAMVRSATSKGWIGRSRRAANCSHCKCRDPTRGYENDRPCAGHARKVS